jgi:uncharacterized protein YggU (UPF0235/DUF167 family)
MIITVTVHANNRVKNTVEKDMFGEIHVYTSVRPQHGEANVAVTELLAAHFNTSKSCVMLKKGSTSKVKVFEVVGA